MTGESVPVEKGVAAVTPTAPLGDRANMAFSGTRVTYGQSQGVVVATAEQAEIGRIGHLLRDAPQLTTLLIRQMATVAK